MEYLDSSAEILVGDIVFLTLDGGKELNAQIIKLDSFNAIISVEYQPSNLAEIPTIKNIKYPSNLIRFKCRKPIEPTNKLDNSVNRPAHYTQHPSGVECIEITEHMNFNTGNAMKYLWRAGLKGDGQEDLQKAAYYIAREIERGAK